MNKYKTTIEVDALEWWGNLSSLRKTQLCDTNTDIVGHITRWESISLTHIIAIYTAEHPTAPTVEENGSEGAKLIDATDFVESALNAYWYEANWALTERKDLGYIEKSNYIKQRDKAKYLLTKIGNDELAVSYVQWFKAYKESNQQFIQLAEGANKLKADNKLLRDALQNIHLISNQWDSNSHNQITSISKTALEQTK